MLWSFARCGASADGPGFEGYSDYIAQGDHYGSLIGTFRGTSIVSALGRRVLKAQGTFAGDSTIEGVSKWISQNNGVFSGSSLFSATLRNQGFNAIHTREPLAYIFTTIYTSQGLVASIRSVVEEEVELGLVVT